MAILMPCAARERSRSMASGQSRMTVSESSRTSVAAGTPVSALQASTVSMKWSWSWSWSSSRADTLTCTSKGIPGLASPHVAASVQVCRITEAPMPTMIPVRSAISMNAHLDRLDAYWFFQRHGASSSRRSARPPQRWCRSPHSTRIDPGRFGGLPQA